MVLAARAELEKFRLTDEMVRRTATAKELWIVPRAGHVNSFTRTHAGYAGRVALSCASAQARRP